MIRDEQGSMSAFLAMLFLVFLLLISVCVEGIYMYTARGKAMGIYMSGLSHTKGNYQKELADMYHIYAMDPRYHKKIETDFPDISVDHKHLPSAADLISPAKPNISATGTLDSIVAMSPS